MHFLPSKSASLCLALATSGMPAIAAAQTASTDTQSVSETSPAAPVSRANEWDGREIVVTAPRLARGAALVPPEFIIDATEIEAHGADSIAELLEALAARTGGQRPILLVNGERIEGGGGIASFPPEAIERIEVLPLEAAEVYGYPSGRRLVNIVLKERFESLTTLASGSGATQGGGGIYTADISRIAIAGRSRWSIQLQTSRNDALLESRRNIPAGQGGGANNGDARYRSIRPESNSLHVSIERAAPFGPFLSTVQLSGDYSDGQSLLGLSVSPRSGSAILKGRSSSSGGAALVSLSGLFDGSPVNASTRYAVNISRSRVARGFGVEPVFEDAGNEPAPFGLIFDESRTVSHSAALQLGGGKKLFKLPAGPVSSSMQLGADTNRSVTRTNDEQIFVSRRSNANGRASFTFPVNSAAAGPLPGMGDINFQLSGGGDVGGGEKPRTQFNYGLYWAPAKSVSLNASIGQSSAPPTSDLLAAPLIETPNVRLYDFVTGERVDIVTVRGGNPDLRAAKASTIDLRLSIQPAFVKKLSLQTAYRRSTVRDGIGQLPALTSAVEAAFPDRIVRDADGGLQRLDVRPINIARSRNEGLTTSLAWTISFAAPVAAKGTSGTSLSLVGKGDAGDRGRALNLTLTHEWKLAEDVLLRDGFPLLDRLAGDGGTGIARHNLSARAAFNLSGLGLDLDFRWASSSVARNAGIGGSPETRLDFSSKTQVDMRVFANMSRLGDSLKNKVWAKGLRLALDIDNLLDQRVSVVDQDGRVPAGFTRDELDPLGRTVKLSLRKLF